VIDVRSGTGCSWPANTFNCYLDEGVIRNGQRRMGAKKCISGMVLEKCDKERMLLPGNVLVTSQCNWFRVWAYTSVRQCI